MLLKRYKACDDVQMALTKGLHFDTALFNRNLTKLAFLNLLMNDIVLFSLFIITFNVVKHISFYHLR